MKAAILGGRGIYRNAVNALSLMSGGNFWEFGSDFRVRSDYHSAFSMPAVVQTLANAVFFAGFMAE
ncbi:hypothetical protein [Endozoicomonas acroporae]|uniref:hypothetical protein n=1 Tax=Endozoicomonas acroporae TaxID=1701104 RepID=UPI0013D8444E|nr:hypothetical protein [Endozoicomonas acroporae]